MDDEDEGSDYEGNTGDSEAEDELDSDVSEYGAKKQKTSRKDVEVDESAFHRAVSDLTGFRVLQADDSSVLREVLPRSGRRNA